MKLKVIVTAALVALPGFAQAQSVDCTLPENAALPACLNVTGLENVDNVFQLGLPFAVVAGFGIFSGIGGGNSNSGGNGNGNGNGNGGTTGTPNTTN